MSRKSLTVFMATNPFVSSIVGACWGIVVPFSRSLRLIRGCSGAQSSWRDRISISARLNSFTRQHAYCKHEGLSRKRGASRPCARRASRCDTCPRLLPTWPCQRAHGTGSENAGCAYRRRANAPKIPAVWRASDSSAVPGRWRRCKIE